jgi:tetratricopeptide (TPR) repeat protein
METVSALTETFIGALRRRPWLQLALLVVAALTVLWPTFDAGFIWDDTQQIVDSPTIEDPASPARYFSLNAVESWGSEGRGGEGIDTYRPLYFNALWLVYAINGADAFWFHAAVITAHLAVCFLLWFVTRRWLESDLAAALVFSVVAIHPVTSEAYLWVSAICEPLSVASLLGALLIIDSRRHRDGGWPITATAAGLLMLAGLLFKEAVITALPAVSVYLWRVRGVKLRALSGLWAAAAAFLALRIHALEGLQATGDGTEQRLDALRNLPVLILDALRSLLTLQPVGVRHLHWDYRDVTWTTSLIAAAVLALFVFLAFRARRRAPLTPTALAVTICMLVPVALITTVPGWSGFGRYLYLPWAFIALACAEGAMYLQPLIRSVAPRARPVLGVFVAVFLALELLGLRHALWVYHSQENLARASVKLQPHAPDGWEWLGNHYLEIGDLPNAARCYAEAVAIEPGIYRPRHNLAAALYYLGRPAEALEHETAVATIHGVTADGATIAAAASLDLELWDEAERWLHEGLERDPDNERLLELEARWRDERPEPDG